MRAPFSQNTGTAAIRELLASLKMAVGGGLGASARRTEEVGGCRGTAEQISLAEVETELVHLVELVLGFDSLATTRNPVAFAIVQIASTTARSAVLSGNGVTKVRSTLRTSTGRSRTYRNARIPSRDRPHKSCIRDRGARTACAQRLPQAG